LFVFFVQGADMMFDLLSTCYSDYIPISRPQTLISSLDNSLEEEEREPSPVHLSSAMSTSSRVSCFSRRLVELDKNKNSNKTSLVIGRGRGIETNLSKIDKPLVKERDDDDAIENKSTTSPIPSVSNSSKFYFINQ
jgi:hypothetical protein